MNARIAASAVSVFAAAGAAAAILIPTAASNAESNGGVGSGIPIASLTKTPSLPAPGQLRDTLVSSAKTVGIDPSSLHLVGGGVWMGQKAGQVCAFVPNQEGLGGGCWDNATVRKGGIALETRSMRGDGLVSRVGVVPDGYTRAVAVTDSGDKVAAVEIAGNVYSISGRGIAAIEISGASFPTLSTKVAR